MKKSVKRLMYIVMPCLVAMASCSHRGSVVETLSPDGSIRIDISTKHNVLRYRVFCNNNEVISESPMGFTFSDAEDFGDSLEVVDIRRHSMNETWSPVWGTDASIKNYYNETVITLKEYSRLQRNLVLTIRAYDDGVAFRYTIPGQVGDSLYIVSENTGFRFAADDSVWWIPAGEFAYESLYRNTRLSEVPDAATPMTVSTKDGVWLCVHEAALVNYSEMYLQQSEAGKPVFRTALWPEPDGIAARVETPFTSPWRCIIIGMNAGGMATSHLIQNLNEDCRIEDTSWIRPVKFVGIWWGMHIGTYTWFEGPQQGATTKRAKEYIDFAAAHGIEAVLAEGWNKGWETWAGNSVAVQDFCTPAKGFDLDEVVRYADSKGIRFISHHETGCNIPMYEAQLDSAMQLCRKLGIGYLKTGYAGPVIPEGYPHHGQYMVKHYQRVVETAAKYQICLDVHESIKPTGLDRTWPNLMSQEAIRGNEWNATYKATPPSHTTILPFTRFVAGPADYTPGIFKVNHSPEKNKRLYCTLSHQLALYVVFYSPMMMVSDMIENYENVPAFRFIEDIPCSWHESIIALCRPGDYVCTARRYGDTWYVGAITDENCRLLTIPLWYLRNEGSYLAEIWCDARDCDWEKSPGSIEYFRVKVSSGDSLLAALSKTGGWVMKLSPWKESAEGCSSVKDFNQQSKEKMPVFAKSATIGEKATTHRAYQKPVKYVNNFSMKYAASGNKALSDGIRGNYNFAVNWQGFEGNDMDVVLDLGSVTDITSISTAFLDSPNDWIFAPKRVVFSVSTDGNSFKTVAEKTPQASDEGSAGITRIASVSVAVGKLSGRYVRVVAENVGVCPSWHQGRGKKAWLFCDEVVVE